MIARRAERFRVALDACLGADHDQLVVWSERGAGGPELRSAPVSVAPLLREHLWGAAARGRADLGDALDRGRPLATRARASASRARASSCSPRRSTSSSRRACTCRATPRIRARPGGIRRSPTTSPRSCARATAARSASSRAGAALEAVRGLVAAELGAYTCSRRARPRASACWRRSAPTCTPSCWRFLTDWIPVVFWAVILLGLLRSFVAARVESNAAGSGQGAGASWSRTAPPRCPT